MGWTRTVFVGSIAVGVVVWSVIAFDWSWWAKVLGYLLAVAAHACLAGMIVTAAYVGRFVAAGVLPRRNLWSALGFLVAVVVLGFVLFRFGQMVIALPVDGVWKALYVLLTASAFWIAAAASYVVLSPDVPRWTVTAVAANVATSVVTIVATALLLALFTAHLARNRQDDEDDDAIAIPVVQSIDGGVYVALGDSYSAGEGLAPFLEGTARPDEDGRRPCHRSVQAYPMLLDFANDVERAFVACSGAITADVDLLPTTARDHPAQLDAAPQSDVTLVTVTIGGNDAAFAAVVQSCFFFEDCIEADFEPPSQDTEHRRVVFPSRAPLDAWAADALVLLERNVQRVYASVAERYPDARRVVIGYPYLFPDGKAPLWQNDCALVLRRVKESERDALRELTDGLNAMLAERAAEAGLEFISPAAAWDGHEPCGKNGQYTNALKPFGADWKPLDGGSFHPNSQGQRALARLVACYLNANPTPPPAGETAGEPSEC